MEVVCPDCKQIFSYLGGGREPRVLPCGDSYCNDCLQKCSISYSFICVKCGIHIETENTFPLNKLYYEFQTKFNQYLKKKDYYDSPSISKGAEDELGRQRLKYDQKCMNPFCLRPRYQADDTIEMFCSIACKKEHEELYID